MRLKLLGLGLKCRPMLKCMWLGISLLRTVSVARRTYIIRLAQWLVRWIKAHRPWLVLWWVTTTEDWALWTFVRSSVWTLIWDRPSIAVIVLTPGDVKWIKQSEADQHKWGDKRSKARAHRIKNYVSTSDTLSTPERLVWSSVSHRVIVLSRDLMLLN